MMKFLNLTSFIVSMIYPGNVAPLGLGLWPSSLLAFDCNIGRNNKKNLQNMNCEHPQLIYNKYLGHRVLVPCGKCDTCRIQKSNIYSMRVYNECEKHAYNVFFTLHYSNDYIPVLKDGSKYLYLRRRNDTSFMNSSVYIPDDVELIPLDYHFDVSRIPNNVISHNSHYDNDKVSNGEFRGVLYYPDVQSLIKRLRLALKYDFDNNYLTYERNESKDFVFTQLKLRYVICGEYGGESFRPHYHGILHTKSKTISEWFIKNLSKFWIFEDWSIAAIPNKHGQTGLPSYCSAGSASQYVSKYVTSVVSKFNNRVSDLFPAFIKTSKIPYYGLSEIDEDLGKKITLGYDVDSFKHYEKKSDGLVLAEPSILLLPRLEKRFNGIDKYSIEELSRIVCFSGEPEYTPKGKFIKWIRRRMLKTFGNCYFTTVLSYLQRVQRFKLYMLKVKIENTFKECGYSLYQHARSCYNTLADLYPKNDEFLEKNAINIVYEKTRESVHNLVSVLRNYDFTDFDLLDLLINRSYNYYSYSRHVYKEKYIKQLMPKHFNQSVNNYG